MPSGLHLPPAEQQSRGPRAHEKGFRGRERGWGVGGGNACRGRSKTGDKQRPGARVTGRDTLMSCGVASHQPDPCTDQANLKDGTISL